MTKFRRKIFDVAICSEVIEHVTNPVKLLKAVSHNLKKGGMLILTTPHDPKQWTVLDDYGEHKKRFLISEIKTLLKEYEIKRIYTVGFPSFRLISWIYNKIVLISGIKHGSNWRGNSFLNSFFNLFLRQFLKVDDIFNSFIMGTNIVVFAQKRN